MKKIMHVINYYHEGFGYQENFISYYQLINGYDVVIVTSDYYFPFPDYNKTMSNYLGDRKVGSGISFDNGVQVIRKKSHLALLSIVYNSLQKVITQDKDKLIDIQEKINRAVENLSSIR